MIGGERMRGELSGRSLAAALGAACLLCALASGCAGAPRKADTSVRSEHNFFIDGPVGKLRVSDGGDPHSERLPVVFLHGLGGDLETWRAQLDHLRETRRAIAFDARGHGQSARAAPGTEAASYTVEGLADDIDAVANALGLQRFVLVGHSISGCALQSYAARYGRSVMIPASGASPARRSGNPAGVVAVDAIGDFSRAGTPAEIAAFIQSDEAMQADPAKEAALFTEMLGPPARDATRARVLQALGEMDPKAFAPLRASMAHFTPPLSSDLGVPLLIVEAADNNFPVRFSSLYPSQAAVQLPHVSHWLMLDDAAAFNRVLDAFLERLDAAAHAP